MLIPVSASRPAWGLLHLSLCSLTLAVTGCAQTEIEYQDTSSPLATTGIEGSALPTATGPELGPTQDASASSAPSTLTEQSTGSSTSGSHSVPDTNSESSSGNPAETTSFTDAVSDSSSDSSSTLDPASSTSDTPSSTDSSTGSSSDASSGTSSTDPSDTSDPDAVPTAGASLRFKSADASLGGSHPRVYIAKVRLQPVLLPDAPVAPSFKPSSFNPSPPAKRGAQARPHLSSDAVFGPEYAIERVVRDYPIEIEAGGFSARMPDLGLQALDPALKRSGLYMVALYDDKDQNKRWDPADGFVAASPSLFYLRQHPEKKNVASWYRADRIGRAAQLSQLPVDQESFANAVKPQSVQPEAAQPLFAFGQAPTQRSFRLHDWGTNIDQRVRFLATLYQAEILELAANFRPGPRRLDIPFADTATASPGWFGISQERLRPITPRESQRIAALGLQLQIPPGIALDRFVAFPIAGYDRPIGAAQPSPEEHLTKDSDIIAFVCAPKNKARIKSVFASVIFTSATSPNDAWFTDPVGALYGASLHLSPGWTLGVIEAEGSGRARLDEESPMPLKLQVNRLCGSPIDQPIQPVDPDQAP